MLEGEVLDLFLVAENVMTLMIQAKNLTLSDLEAKFGLRPTDDDHFFSEWLDNLPQLPDLDKQSLDRVEDNYFNLLKYRPLSENLVKMVVLSPLLDLAGFYRSPFRVETEASIQISAEDEGEVVQGRIDLLVLQGQFWILVVESKGSQFSLEPAIPQALAYMLDSPNLEKPTLGLVTNGSSFIFLKLAKQGMPQYALSYELTLRRGNDLYSVLSVLKRFGQILVQR